MSDTPPAGDLGQPFVPEELKVTSTFAFLVIARYNRDSWNQLGTVPWGTDGDTLQDAAHERAEIAIPEASYGGVTKPLSFLPGALHVWSFDTSLHASLREAFIQLARTKGIPPGEPIQVSEQVSKPIVEAQLNARPANGSDPGVGWVTVVEALRIADFFNHLGGRYGPLCQMYDIEVIPLNKDNNTDDLYQYMTPVNWRK